MLIIFIVFFVVVKAYLLGCGYKKWKDRKNYLFLVNIIFSKISWYTIIAKTKRYYNIKDLL
jgi:hypothetical protein